jgi:hypothetical protein
MSKQRKLRSKLSFDADEAEAADAAPPPPPTSTSGAKKDPSKPKKATLLSFGDDEEPLSTSSSSKAKKKEKVSKFHRGGAAPAPTPGAVDAGAAHKPPAGAKEEGRFTEQFNSSLMHCAAFLSTSSDVCTAERLATCS